MSEDQVVNFPCRYCDGTGKRPREMFSDTWGVTGWYDDGNCPVCKGHRSLRLRFLDTPMNCDSCSGSGKLADSTIYSPSPATTALRTCDKCYGLGVRCSVPRRIEIWDDNRWLSDLRRM